jgi:hypothetical protein
VRGTATLECKAWQTEASQIVNELLRKIDR